MAWNRPSLPEIVSRIISDVETRLSTGKLLARSFLAILARAYAGAVHLVYGYIAWAIQQLFPDTAIAEYMTRWASIWGVQRTAATYATGNVIFTGVNGTLVPEGTRLKRSDGAFFLTTASGAVSGGSVTIAVKAVNAGTAGNTPGSSAIAMVNAIAGISTAATTDASGLTGGLDSESDESLRAKLIDRIQQAPHGGALFDYVKWAKEVAGVTRAWAYANPTGLGTVGLTFVLDGLPDNIPDAGKVAEVQAYIDDPSRRPATADLTVYAPIGVPLDFTIEISPDTAEVRAAVEESLRDLLRRTAEPGGTILLSKIREAVSVAAGENDNSVTVPNADVTHTTGQIATFGVITWV